MRSQCKTMTQHSLTRSTKAPFPYASTHPRSPNQTSLHHPQPNVRIQPLQIPKIANRRNSSPTTPPPLRCKIANRELFPRCRPQQPRNIAVLTTTTTTHASLILTHHPLKIPAHSSPSKLAKRPSHERTAISTKGEGGAYRGKPQQTRRQERKA